MANIFVDLHQASLGFSFHLTLEQKLGHRVFFPIGLEWAKEFWQIHKPYNYSMDTAKQYLDLRDVYIPKDNTPPLNEIVSKTYQYYLIKDIANNYERKHITLEQFKAMDIDIIIASIPDHWITFEKLRQKFKPKARLVCQMGNIGWHNLELIKNGQIKNLLASVKPFKINSNINSVFYHQEIDLNVFKQVDVPRNYKISSFVIGLPDEKVFFDYKASLPEYSFTAYASKYTPFINTMKELSEKISETDFIFNHKPYGDGFGHIVYSSAFVGRPLLIDFKDYKDKLAGELLTDSITAIDIGSRTTAQNVEIIRKSDPFEMGRNIYKRVKECVDYEKEAEDIKNFLSIC